MAKNDVPDGLNTVLSPEKLREQIVQLLDTDHLTSKDDKFHKLQYEDDSGWHRIVHDLKSQKLSLVSEFKDNKIGNPSIRNAVLIKEEQKIFITGMDFCSEDDDEDLGDGVKRIDRIEETDPNRITDFLNNLLGELNLSSYSEELGDVLEGE